MRQVMLYFEGMLSPRLSLKAYKKWGNASVDVLKNNGCDIVITNPPYSDKMPIQLIEMCKKYNKDFAFVGPLHLIYKKEVKKWKRN